MWIVKFKNGDYQYHRRATKVMYESRMARGKNINEARVFTTLGAAKNSDGCKLHNGSPVQVYIKECE